MKKFFQTKVHARTVLFAHSFSERSMLCLCLLFVCFQHLFSNDFNWQTITVSWDLLLQIFVDRDKKFSEELVY